jgi:hypothetical protein
MARRAARRLGRAAANAVRAAGMALAVAWVYAVLIGSWVVLELFERRRRRRLAVAARARPPAAATARRVRIGPRRDDLPAFASFHPDAPLAAVIQREVTQADVDEMLRQVERHLADR